MDISEHSLTPEKNRTIPVDEDFFEEFHFKPLSKGLGFHKKEQETVRFAKRDLQVTSTNPKQVRHSSASFNSIQAKLGTTVNEASATSISKDDLGAIYSSSPTHSAPLNLNLKKESVTKYKTASKWKQFLAWFIDVTIIAVGQILMLGLLFFAAGIKFSAYKGLLIQPDILVLQLVLFSFIYMLYFTIMDLGQSLGKSLLKLKLVNISNSQVSASMTGTRSFVSLVSLVLLGLPLVLGFQDKISDTYLIED